MPPNGTVTKYVRFERSGPTQAVKPGDTIEVEIEGIGVLRNTVAA